MKRIGLTVVLLAVILVLLVGGGYFLLKRNGSSAVGGVIKDSGANLSDYQAVFLTNGQVYFGKMTDKSNDEIQLKDIYYLQVQQQLPTSETKASPSPSASPDQKVVLVKLGKELHGPNDLMRISRQQVLFTETLKSDSQVVDAIKKDKETNK